MRRLVITDPLKIEAEYYQLKKKYDELVKENHLLRHTLRGKIVPILKEHKRLLEHFDAELELIMGKVK